MIGRPLLTVEIPSLVDFYATFLFLCRKIVLQMGFQRLQVLHLSSGYVCICFTEVAANLTTFHGWILVHFLHFHAFWNETNSFLKCNQLLVGHDVRVDLLSKQM